MQIRRLAGRLRDPELSLRLLAPAIEIERGAQEMDSMKEFPAMVGMKIGGCARLSPISCWKR
jgi:hypothetical protein